MAYPVNDPINYCRQIDSVVKKNIHLLKEGNPENIDIRSLVSFNNRLVIANSKLFLEAMRSELGGEIIVDSSIGSFLYYGSEETY